MKENYVIGIDYGSDSCRAVIIDATSGREIESEVYHYPRWKEKKYCDFSNNIFRQHPLDYLEGLEKIITNPLSRLPNSVRENIKGISIDTTGSTPVAIDKTGTPLALLPEFSENPNAMFVLWKDHSATVEADEINCLAKTWGGVDYTKYSGGVYSSEWYWAKLLHIIRVDESISNSIYSWLEHCDWIPAVLTGIKDANKIKRGRCSAGHKAMWNMNWNGLPSEEFLNKLNPRLGTLRKNMYTETFTAEEAAGVICEEWSKKLNLPPDVIIGIGAFDAHMGAVGGQAKPYSFVKVMGTSTCDILVVPKEELGETIIEGICGQVDGSVVSGMIGLEAGQSGFGDIYNWFKEILLWPTINSNLFSDIEIEKLKSEMLPLLEKSAINLSASDCKVISLDWLNGRRTPNANQKLQGVITGLTLGTNAPMIYRSLVESTAFGAKAILDCFLDKGIRVDEVIGIGGVAKKSPLIMQIMSDVLNKPIKIAESLQTVALGSAIFAAKVSGIYPSIEEAQKVLGSKFEKEYFPIPENVEIYKKKYEEYKETGKYFESKVD